MRTLLLDWRMIGYLAGRKYLVFRDEITIPLVWNCQ
jgi:hypothetical protein